MTWLLAAALGAEMVEKRFAIDKNHSAFHDHKLSAESHARNERKKKREISLMPGQELKPVQESEKALALFARMSIVATKDLPERKVTSTDDIAWLRPFEDEITCGKRRVGLE